MISATGLEDFIQCEAKYYLQHYLHLRSVKKFDALILGGLWHEFMAGVHGRNSVIPEVDTLFANREDVDNFEMAKVRGLARAYGYSYPDCKFQFARQGNTEVTVPHGRVDLITDNPPTLWDHKLVGERNKHRYDNFTMMYQVGLYLSDLPHVDDVIIHIISKPDIRERRGEDMASVERRTYELAKANATATFHRERYKRSEFKPDEILSTCNLVEKEVEWKLGKGEHPNLGIIGKGDGFRCNGKMCSTWRCDYEVVCRTGAIPFGVFEMGGVKQ